MAPETDDSSPADVDLINAAQRGEYDAFEVLVERYRDRVYRLAHGMLKSEAEAEEVMQEAFLSIFRNIASFRGDSAPGSWIYRIAANATLMRLRTRRRKPLLSVEDQAGDSGEDEGLWPSGDWARKPDDQLMNQELQTVIEAAIDELPEKHRMVLLLRDVEGQTNAEVADALEVTVATVKARLHRSRLAVREAVEKYFDAE